MITHNREGAPSKKKTQCLGTKYAKALHAHERAEAKLQRAFRAWEKTRAALKRADKRLTTAQAATEER